MVLASARSILLQGDRIGMSLSPCESSVKTKSSLPDEKRQLRYVMALQPAAHVPASEFPELTRFEVPIPFDLRSKRLRLRFGVR